jgi:hypothetical protein
VQRRTGLFWQGCGCRKLRHSDRQAEFSQTRVASDRCDSLKHRKHKKCSKQEKTMHKAIFAALAAIMLGAMSGCVPSDGRLSRYYVVAGVEEGDLLKLRAGPGIGFRVIAGLPNGTVLQVNRCEQTGSTRWCKVALKQPSVLTGYVSWAYLQEYRHRIN